MVCGLIVAGHETTAHVIARGVLTLLRHPAELAALRADPGLMPDAVEEILRLQVPGHGALLRVATADVTLPSGGAVARGRAVLAPMVAANDDPARFPGPGRLDIRRTDNRHPPSVTGRTSASARTSPGWRSRPPSKRSCAACRGSRSPSRPRS